MDSLSFNQLITQPFTLFGNLHFGVIATLIIILFLTFLLRKKSYIRYVYSTILIAQVIIFTFYHIIQKDYDLARFLPLHLCTVCAILAPYALLSRSKNAEKLVIFWGFIPALLAVLLPDMGANDNIQSFRFWEFFVSHIIIVASSFYLAINHSKFFKINSKSILKPLKAFGLLIIYAFAIVYPLNYIFNWNYLYLMKRASNGMGFLPTGNLYLPSLMSLSLIVFVVTYLIYAGVYGAMNISNKKSVEQKTI